MSRLQKIIIFGALCNAIVLLLFPPYDVVALDRRQMFDSFYPVFAVPPGRILGLYLLFNAFACLTVNAALAWLVLGRDAGPAVSPRYYVMLLGAANLAVMLLFPPFEIYPFPPAVSVGTFDGFYFLFGDMGGRNIYWPLLTLELILLGINALAFWLLLGGPRAPAPVAEPGPKTMLDEAAMLIERAREKIAARKQRASGKDDGRRA